MALRCGIVGLPNVGKSTIFNALTAAGARVENFEFCTIEPNEGVVVVPDPRMDRLAEILPHERLRRTTLEFVDVAGLVEGAAREGRGRGAEFLSHVRATDTLVHVVRCFEDPDVVCSHATLDPVQDAGIVNLELLLSDMELVERGMDKLHKLARVGDKAAGAELEALSLLLGAMDDGAFVRTLPEDMQAAAADLALLTAKPMLYMANLSEEQLAGSPKLEALSSLAEQEGTSVVPICGDMEAEIALLEEVEERRAFLADLGLDRSGLDRLVEAAYRLSGLITFYTAVGGKEIGSWTLQQGQTAQQAAGKIHSDMARGFIRAEVVSFDDLVRLGSEAAARQAGLVRVEGRDYLVRDGDVIHFRFNV